MGALTSKPYAFVARSWELKSVESVDIFDSYMSSIRYDSRNNSVLRVLPVVNANLNQEWISDKIRFFYDGLSYQRLSSPWLYSSLAIYYLRVTFNVHLRPIDGFSFPVGWAYAADVFRVIMLFISNTFKNTFNLIAILGSYVDLNVISNLNRLINSKGFTNNILFGDLVPVNNFNNDIRENYIFKNEFIFYGNSCFLICLNPRFELPALNIRLREVFMNKNFKIYSFGANFDSNYQIENLGFSREKLMQLANGRVAGSLKLNLGVSSILIGLGGLKLNLFNVFKQLPLKNPIFSVFSSPVSINFFETSYFNDFRNFFINNINIMYNLGYDQLKLNSKYLSNFNQSIESNSFVAGLSVFNIYQGSHGDLGALNAHIIFPAATQHTESRGLFLNILGEMKNVKLVTNPIHPMIRTNISIINTLTTVLKFDQLDLSIFKSINKFDYSSIYQLVTDKTYQFKPDYNNMICSINQLSVFGSFINEFFLTDALTKSSQNLALASSRRSFFNFTYF